MPIPYQKLSDAGVQVAGGLNEIFLNRFSKAHKIGNPAIYTGSTMIKEFDDWIRITFHVANPIKFSFGRPITATRFMKVWKRHLLEKRSELPSFADETKAPPNLSLSSSKVEFTVDVFDGQDMSNVKLSVDFAWDLSCRAAVFLEDDGAGGRAVKLEPIKIAFSKPLSVIATEIRSKIVDPGSSTTNPRINPWSSDDPVWCAKVEQLILLLLNNVLNTQIRNFVQQFELPRAIELVDGVALQADYLLLDEGYLIVGAQIIPTFGPSHSDLQVAASELTQRYREFTEKEKFIPDEQVKRGLSSEEISHSDAVDWIENLAERSQSEVEALREISKPSATTNYPENIFLLSNDKLFDSVANSQLKISEGWQGSKQLDRLVKAEAGWSLAVENGRAQVVTGGVNVTADATIGGFARVCHFDFDPKKFGKWRCHGPCVDLKPDPHFGISAFPTFPSDGIYLRARLTTQGIKLSFCDWPSWANQILGWITSVLTRPIIGFLATLISIFRIKIAGYPLHFPGTGIEWETRINTSLGNAGEYLVISGDPTFK